MIILDTDHLSVFMDERDPRHSPLINRLEAEEQVACTVVSIEEILRGWLALINKRKSVHEQIPAYARLGQLIQVLSEWTILAFDDLAADQFAALRRQLKRVGTMDLKIASIALTNNAVLASANLRDYAFIPNLRCENWLDR